MWVLKRCSTDSGYGFPNYDGDANDYWRVEIVDHSPQDPASGDRLKALRSVFRLIHINEGCALFSHSVKCKLGFELLPIVAIDANMKCIVKCQSGVSTNKKLPA